MGYWPCEVPPFLGYGKAAAFCGGVRDAGLNSCNGADVAAARLRVPHDEGQGSQGQGPRHTARRGGWAHSPLVQKGERSCRYFLQKKGPTHKSMHFESPRPLWPVLPWPSKRHDGRPRPTSLLRFRSKNDTRAAAPRARTRPPRRGSSASARRARRPLQVRCATIVPVTLLARQSSRPTYVQRAQLVVGTSFRFW